MRDESASKVSSARTRKVEETHTGEDDVTTGSEAEAEAESLRVTAATLQEMKWIKKSALPSLREYMACERYAHEAEFEIETGILEEGVVQTRRKSANRKLEQVEIYIEHDVGRTRR